MSGPAQGADDPEFRHQFTIPDGEPYVVRGQCASPASGFQIGWEHGGPKPDGIWRRTHHVLAAPLALPPGESAARLALPWGDSAYTSMVVQRWQPGVLAEPGGVWCMGPPANGLTSSSEGERRRAQVEFRQGIVGGRDYVASCLRLAAVSDLWDLPGMQSLADDSPWTLATLPAHPPRRYAYPVPTLKEGDPFGWVDADGQLHTDTWPDTEPDPLPGAAERIRAALAFVEAHRQPYTYDTETTVSDLDDQPGTQGGGTGWEVLDAARCRTCGHRRDWHWRGHSGCDYGPAECAVNCSEFLSPDIEDMELCRCGHRSDVHGPGCWVDNNNASSEPDCHCTGFTRALTPASPAFIADAIGRTLWCVQQIYTAITTSLGIKAPGELLGHGVARRTEDGRWHLTPHVDDLEGAANLAGVERFLNQSFPTKVYGDTAPPEFFTEVTEVEIRRKP